MASSTWSWSQKVTTTRRGTLLDLRVLTILIVSDAILLVSLSITTMTRETLLSSKYFLHVTVAYSDSIELHHHMCNPRGIW
jgi:hypothetical protein